jgi:hypothetical protein
MIDCTKFALPTGQFFGENCEFFAPKSANLPPKIWKSGEIYAQTLNLRTRIRDFVEIDENY